MTRGRLTGRDPGGWTDDTDMAIGVLRGLLATGADISEYTSDAIMDQFIQWYESEPSDIGGQTRAVLSEVARGTTRQVAIDNFTNRYPDRAGNGSLMRTGPVGLCAFGDLRRVPTLARQVSALTHAGRESESACALWATAIAAALDGAATVREAMSTALAHLDDDAATVWRERLSFAESADMSDLLDNGYVVTALQAAWRSAVSGEGLAPREHFIRGLETAIRIGGDTDTVAAITGALLGAFCGASAIPLTWQQNLHGWPEHVGVSDLRNLACALVEFPQCAIRSHEEWLEYYRSEFAPHGRAVNLPNEPRLQLSDVTGFDPSRTDAVISLCRFSPTSGPAAWELVWLTDDDHNLDTAGVLANAADLLQNFLEQHNHVTLHCVRAESRTPSVAATWLARHRGHQPDAARDIVREAMPWIRPNPTLWEAVTAAAVRARVPN
jgi:ADP-ribosylglycohydrolase